METLASGGACLRPRRVPARLAHDPLLHHREKSVLLSSNRKLERKVKELTIQIDDERQHVSDQKDQVGGGREPSGMPSGFGTHLRDPWVLAPHQPS